MTTLNPKMKERPRVENYDPESYKTVEWEKVNVTRKRDMLRQAKIERKATGKFSVKINRQEPEEIPSASSLG